MTKCGTDIKLASAGILLYVDRLTGEDKIISQKWCLSCVHNLSASILKE
jgi:hypothetical protein